VAQKILYLHGMSAIGGAERDLLSLLRRLDRLAWEVTVACPGTGAFGEHLERLNIPVIPIDFPPWRKLSSLISRYRGVRAIRGVLESLRPSIVHVNDVWWVPYAVRAVRGCGGGVALIAHVRQNIKPEKVRAYSLNQADYVLAVSNQVRAALEQGGVQSARVTTLYSGVDLTACSKVTDGRSVRTKHGIPADALVIGTIANLLPIKGYEIMIEALRSIVAEVPTTHYMVVGSGSDSYVGHLRRLSSVRGLSDRIHFVGFQDQPQAYLSAMDLYVQPSLDEAFGLAAVEAMGMAKAVVATRVGGLQEVVAHGESGLLVPPRDPSELSRAVVTLLRDLERREELGTQGLARAHERFDVKATVAGIENVYRDVLARRQVR
jgi:glycosyltransferase involved in cell wall biosynthesis